MPTTTNEPAVPVTTTPTSAIPSPAKAAPGTPLVARILLGLAGLSLVVGFFFPWIRIANVAGGENILSGIALLSQESLGGTPSMALLLVPVLGLGIAIAGFLGFRYAAHVVLGLTLSLVVYAIVVLFQLFVAHTGIGLWITAGSLLASLVFAFGTLAWLRKSPS